MVPGYAEHCLCRSLCSGSDDSETELTWLKYARLFAVHSLELRAVVDENDAKERAACAGRVEAWLGIYSRAEVAGNALDGL